MRFVQTIFDIIVLSVFYAFVPVWDFHPTRAAFLPYFHTADFLNLVGSGLNYFNSTLAPAASIVAFIFSASSFATPSLTAFGADSTKAFASPKPKPVMSFTALITANLFAPTSANTTSNSLFSSAAAATGPAATATAAAALTPHVSSNVFQCFSEWRNLHLLRGILSVRQGHRCLQSC